MTIPAPMDEATLIRRIKEALDSHGAWANDIDTGVKQVLLALGAVETGPGQLKKQAEEYMKSRQTDKRLQKEPPGSKYAGWWRRIDNNVTQWADLDHGGADVWFTERELDDWLTTHGTPEQQNEALQRVAERVQEFATRRFIGPNGRIEFDDQAEELDKFRRDIESLGGKEIVDALVQVQKEVAPGKDSARELAASLTIGASYQGDRSKGKFIEYTFGADLRPNRYDYVAKKAIGQVGKGDSLKYLRIGDLLALEPAQKSGEAFLCYLALEYVRRFSSGATVIEGVIRKEKSRAEVKSKDPAAQKILDRLIYAEQPIPLMEKDLPGDAFFRSMSINFRFDSETVRADDHKMARGWMSRALGCSYETAGGILKSAFSSGETPPLGEGITVTGDAEAASVTISVSSPSGTKAWESSGTRNLYYWVIGDSLNLYPEDPRTRRWGAMVQQVFGIGTATKDRAGSGVTVTYPTRGQSVRWDEAKIQSAWNAFLKRQKSRFSTPKAKFV